MTEPLPDTNGISRRRLLGVIGAGAMATGGTGVVGATPGGRGRGRSKRFVLHPDYPGLLGGAVGTRERANTLAGSWKTAVDTDGNPGDEKLQLYLDPAALFANVDTVSVDDLTHVSFATHKDVETSGSEPYNVYLQIYTETDGVDDGSWYGYRITAATYYANNLDAPGGEWVTWSTEPGTNELTFYDDRFVGFGYYNGTQPTLTGLQDGETDWSQLRPGAPSTSIDYGAETIKFITFQTGSGYPDEFAAYLDTIEIGVRAGPGNSGHGQVARVDLEA